MNKTDLIAHVIEKTSLKRKDASKAVDTILKGIMQTLKEGKEVMLIGFGSFKVAKRAARKGRHPRTSEVINIPASKAAVFKAGRPLKQAVNH